MKIIRYIAYVLTAALIGYLAASCVITGPEEDVLFSGDESDVSFVLDFRPLGSVEPMTRTPGDAVRHIESLYVLAYDKAGKLVKKALVDNFTTDEPASGSGYAEETHCRATFSLTLPVGSYRIYAVANHDLSDFDGSEDELKSIRFSWNKDASANNQMFGFFSDSESDVINKTAPLISINNASESLHGWVKRVVSKVTVSFDGTNLNENIYIYLHTIQVKDIPQTCFLGKQNSPSDAAALIADGETIYLRDSGSDSDTDGLVITAGVPTGGQDADEVHGETAEAMFFYENMQGTDPNKHRYNNFESKDNKPYGTYVEVKGYYLNKSSDNPSQGNIIYRFMLGKNVTDDFNAERSNHFKVVMKFKNDANDPDWHIEYEPESPEISVPTPLYISYGSNETLSIPVVLRGASVNASTTVTAEIIENPWGYPEHKYYGNSNHDDNNDGFLSFENLKGTVSISANDRNNKWNSTLSGVKPAKVDVNTAHFEVPVYTRPLTLGNSLTGHNPYVSRERKAKVRFTATIDGKKVTQEIEVIQVKRLVNPTGVWRSDDNTAPFNVRLMELNEYDVNANGMVNTDFHPTISDGPWTAHIEEGADWVEIASTGSGSWGTADVKGGTGSEVRFDYRPKNNNTTGEVRCGVIRVTYHNDNCVHYVFVSQGLGTVNLAGTDWQNRNVYRLNELVANPLLEGSMFKFGNPKSAIYATNNYRDGFGFDQSIWGKNLNIYDGTADAKSTFEAIEHNMNGFDGTRKIFTDASARPATYAEWKALESLHRRYGVLYGDECTETMTTTKAAYSYYKEAQQRGMSGMFVWDEDRQGNHVFFPIGSTGFGHRKVNDNAYTSVYGTIDKYGLLKYAQRPKDMPEATAKAVPMYYDLWLQKGAIYWYENEYDAAVDSDGNTTTGSAHDINFYTMLFQTYGSNAVGQKDKNGTVSTDAAFIRCVEP